MRDMGGCNSWCWAVTGSHCCWCLIFFCDRCSFWRMERVSLSSPGSSACLSARDWLLCEVPGVISMSGSEGLVVVWGHWGQARVIWGHTWRHLKSMQRTMVTGFGIILVVNPYSQKLNCFNLFNYFLPVIQVTVHDEKNYYIFFYFVSYEVKELLTYLSNTTQYAWFDKFMFEDNRNTSILSWSVCMSTISIASIWLYTYLWCYFNYNSFKEQ